MIELKRLAVENEDYETAKKIKLEIERIKKAVGSVDPQRGLPISLATAELKEHLAESSLKLGSYKLKPELRFEETLKEFEN